MAPPDLLDVESSFLAFAESQGLAISEPLKIDGKIHRFRLEGDRRGEKSGAFCLWPEGKSYDGKPHGWVQDHHEGGDKHFWQFYSRDNPPPREKPTGEERAAAQARREAEQRQEAERRTEALESAWGAYQAARPVEESCDHAYLAYKRVTPRGGFPFGGQWCGLRTGGMASQSGKPLDSLLFVPMANVQTGRFCALHRVFGRPGADGKFGKGWCSGAGGVFPIAGDVTRGPVFICEGVATGLSVYDLWVEEGEPENPGEYTPCCTVLATMDSGSLARQARARRERDPARRRLVVRDADEAGEKAARAAMEVGFDGVVDSPAGTEG
jgi:putative DNA primase/helicase